MREDQYVRPSRLQKLRHHFDLQPLLPPLLREHTQHVIGAAPWIAFRVCNDYPISSSHAYSTSRRSRRSQAVQSVLDKVRLFYGPAVLVMFFGTA